MSYYLQQYITQLNRKIVLQKLNAYVKKICNIVPDSYADVHLTIVSKYAQRLALGMIMSIIIGFSLITLSITFACINIFSISLIKGLIASNLINLICINMFLRLVDIEALLFVIQFCAILFGAMSAQRIKHTIKDKLYTNGLFKIDTNDYKTSQVVLSEICCGLYVFVSQITSDYKNILADTQYHDLFNPILLMYISHIPLYIGYNPNFDSINVRYIGTFIKNIINDADKLECIDINSFDRYIKFIETEVSGKPTKTDDISYHACLYVGRRFNGKSATDYLMTKFGYMVGWYMNRKFCKKIKKICDESNKIKLQRFYNLETKKDILNHNRPFQRKFCKKCLTDDRTDLYEYEDTKIIRHVDCIKNQLLHGRCDFDLHENCLKKIIFNSVYSEQIKNFYKLNVGDCVCARCIMRRNCLGCRSNKNVSLIKICPAYKICLCDKCKEPYDIYTNNININKDDIKYLHFKFTCKKISKHILQSINKKFKKNKRLYTISDCSQCNDQIGKNSGEIMDRFKKAGFMCIGCINPFKNIC
jgi:hypothetical protein